MKTSKKKDKRPEKSKLVSLHMKLTKWEARQLKLRANWWALGNVSAWLRYTGLKYTPSKNENVSRFITAKKR
jgi:hypothetical protein